MRLLLLLTLACSGSSPDPGDARTDTPTDSAPMDCDAPATTCPVNQPVIGAPCRGALNCPYDAGTFGSWMYTCDAEAWFAIVPCSELPGGGCAPPPLAERCRDPFTGSITGATVQVGPSGLDSFRPFTDGERIRAVVGGQGSAMLEVELQISGADELSCADVSIALSSGSVSPPATQSFVQVHCGSTRRIFSVLRFPDLDCGTGVHDITIDVEIAGVASTQITVEIEAGYLCFG